MKTSPRTRFLLGLAAVAAVGLVWWLLARGGQGAAPVALAPKDGVEHRTAVAPAPVEPSPLTAAAPAAVVGHRDEVAPAQASPAAVPAVAAPSASSLPPSALGSAAPVLPPADEVAATERMYLAHAPLRTPEVADPDSESNRRILQTMVEKALLAPAAADSPGAAHP